MHQFKNISSVLGLGRENYEIREYSFLHKKSVFKFTRLIKTVANCLIFGIKSFQYDLESVSYDSKNLCVLSNV